MSEILGFVSLMGNAEKSNLLVNLAASLSRSDRRVLLVDLGYPVPTLDLLCGVAESAVYTASDVGTGKVSLTDASLTVPLKGNGRAATDRLFLLPASCAECWTTEAVGALLSLVRAEKEYDLALVLFSHETCVRQGLDGLFFLTDADEISLRAAEAQGDEMGADAFLLTGYPTDWDSLSGLTSPVSMIDRLGLPLLGIAPRLPTGLSGILDGCARARAYLCAVRNIANRILGTNTPLLAGVSLAGVNRRRLLASEG